MNRAPAPTAESAQRSLREHVLDKAMDARRRRGGAVDWAALLAMLEDRAIVRYPVGVRFDAEPLRPGEFACLEGLGDRPQDGFAVFVHPMFANDSALLPLLVAYYIPSVNYGEVASHVEAELFGAALLGLDREAYYGALCAAADAVTTAQGVAGASAPASGVGCGGACGCATRRGSP